MELQSILSFLVITEKFKLADLIASGDMQILENISMRLDTLDQLWPVYKYLKKDIYYIPQDNPTYEQYSKENPIYKTYFDFTSGQLRNNLRILIDGTQVSQHIGTPFRDPVEVQIRIQFVEPNQDTLGVNKHRRFLRTGQLQFLVIAKFEQVGDQVFQDRRPLFEAFRIAQFYANKYEGTDGIKILRDIDEKEGGTEDVPGSTKRLLKAYENNPPNQFEELKQEEYNIIFDYLFPGAGTPYDRIVQEVKTLNTGVARIVNLRFAELERRTVDPIRITNPTYGLAVTIPFTFEQTR